MKAAPTPISQSKHDKYVIAHATLASIATLILAPAAILTARYLRAWRYWNIVHLALNALTAVFIIITFALGTAALPAGKSQQFFGMHSDTHHKLGLATFLIVMVQVVLGLGARVVKRPAYNYVALQTNRNPLRLFHILFGIATAGILYAQVYTGFQEWDDKSDSKTTTPKSVWIIYWILFAIEVLVYAVGWAVMEPLGWKKRAAELNNGNVKEAPTGAGDRTGLVAYQSI
ncbi:MAG: hypothetical protein ASARMPRED_000913 [Alectoria sarmentosa]|nr:MAG: hypothetical protein ASARMPRED_000913 [Alectoria sarmentosa]